MVIGAGEEEYDLDLILLQSYINFSDDSGTFITALYISITPALLCLNLDLFLEILQVRMYLLDLLILKARLARKENGTVI